MKNKYDIIIVGSGPAGSMAAFGAASNGKRVCLLERKPKAGTPVRCGEGIGYKGLTRTLEPRPEWIKSTITRARMVSPSGIAVEIGDMDKGWVLDRERMDFDLVKDAIDKGAEYIPNTSVVSAEKMAGGLYKCVCADSNEFFAPCLILADGVESRLARCFGWDTALKPADIETCAFARVKSSDIEPDCCTFYLGSGVAPGGYLWTFPWGAGVANVGLGVIGSKSKAGLPQKLLLDFISRRFPDAEVTDLHCGGVPVSRWLRPLVKEGVMIVGDAARQVNAMSGGGIAYSLYAGKLAGTVAAKSFRGDGGVDYKMLLEYQKEWAKDLGKQQERSFALKGITMSADDPFMERIAETLSKENPNRINFLRVFTRVFARNPVMLLKAFKLFR